MPFDREKFSSRLAALRAEREELRRAQQEQEHERLAQRAAHRAHEAQLGHEQSYMYEETENEQGEEPAE